MLGITTEVIRWVFMLCSDNFQFVSFEFFMAVAMKNGVFWDVTPFCIVKAISVTGRGGI
jgi:hypothetical protein